MKWNQSMQRHWLKVYTISAVAAGLTALTGGVRAEVIETHAPLHHAVHELELAVRFMQEAPHNFGGHREAAIRDSEAAIAQLHVCLETTHTLRFPAWENAEQHPLRRAILVLEEAKHHLQHAAHDFYGHREQALLACDAAIRQLHEALEHEAVVVGLPVVRPEVAIVPVAPAAVGVEIAEMHAPLHHAIHELELAVRFMQEAPHNFGGHREVAIRDSEAAIAQLHVCLEAMRVGSVKVPAWENHERHPLRRAIIALEEARSHLQHAAHDFHGHRERALLLCDEAVRQLHEAVEHERR